MALTQDETEQLIQYLQGSCHTLADAVEYMFQIEEDDLSDENRDQIDDELTLCEMCHWWSENSNICTETDLCGTDCIECCEKHH